jgi:hypothetical protein
MVIGKDVPITTEAKFPGICKSLLQIGRRHSPHLDRPVRATRLHYLGRPGAGLIGACSHAGPGSYAAVHHLPSLPSDLTGLTTPSLIPSLIHLRPEPSGAHHLEHAAQVADLVDLTRTQPRRLGKRVETAVHDRHRRPHKRRACGPGGRPGAVRPGWAAVGAAARLDRANGFANNDPGPSRTRTD